MEKNVGNTDRLIREIIALGIAFAGIYYQSWLGLIAIVPLFTAFIRWYPAYLPFSMCTIKGSK